MQEPRLEIHDPVGVLEIARQARIRALEHARAAAKVAFLERHVLRSLRLFPERLAFELEELGGTALGDHLAVALDLLRRVLGESGARQRERGNEGKRSHATAVSVLFDSPWLSSQLTSILSPLAPPF